MPTIWREQKDHVSDCYFCLTKLKGFSSKTKDRINYPQVSSVTRPVLGVPVHTITPSAMQVTTVDSQESSESQPFNSEHSSSDFVSDSQKKEQTEPSRFNEKELNDLIRDLTLSKKKQKY